MFTTICRARLGAIAFVSVLLVAGCASDPTELNAGESVSSAAADTLPPATPTDVTVPVLATDNTFREPDTTVRVGDTVQFKNGGRNDHDVVPVEGGGWGVGATEFGPGATYEHVFLKPGKYSYYCTIHGTKHRGMVGTITVTA